MSRSHLLAALTYLLLVLSFWLPYAPSSGMPYETTFAWNSENTPFPQSALYYGDPLRVFTSVFYDLGYRLSELLQVPGSYLGQQIVFLVLIWARGLLLYLGIAALVPKANWLAFFSGAIAIVHAADTASMWVGQMNQTGYMFWLALSFYALVLATEPRDGLRPRIFSAMALAACYLCIYSYESPIFLLGLLPIVIVVASPRRFFPNILLFALWYLIPANYAWRFLRRWIAAQSQTYQSTVMRKDFSPLQLANEWLNQIQSSLAFWNWTGGEPHPSHTPYAWAAAAVFLLACLIVYKWNGFDSAANLRAALVALPFGLVICAFSFPAYLFLEGGGGLWRTQFLSSFGSGVTLCALLLIAAAFLPKRQLAAAALGTSLIVYFGVSALANLGRSHWIAWERHRAAVAGILAVAPRIQPDSTLVLTGIPAAADPFGDNLWFDFAIRLAYPRQPLAAIYYRDANRPSPGLNLDLNPASAQWKWNGKSMPPVKHPLPAERTIFLERASNGSIRLLPAWPESVPAPDSVKHQYNPAALIPTGPPPRLAVNRYGPIP